FLNFALYIRSIYLSIAKKSTSFFLLGSYRSNTVVKSPQTVLRHLLIFTCSILFPNFSFRKRSKNCKVEVWSNTSEQTFPPRLQGDAIIIGTRNPSPIGPVRAFPLLKPYSSSCSRQLKSTPVSFTPSEHLPVAGFLGSGGI